MTLEQPKKQKITIHFKTLPFCIIFLSLSSSTFAQNFYRAEKLLSNRQSKELQVELAKKIIVLQKKVHPKKGRHFTQDRVQHGQAILVAPNILLTTIQWLLPQADERSEIELEVNCMKQPSKHRGIVKQWEKVLPQQHQISFSTHALNDSTTPHFQVIYSESKGWALLKLPNHLSCSVISPPSEPPSRFFYAGSSLYMYEPPPNRLAKLTLGGIAAYPMHYYWFIRSGFLLPGTPLFNSQGNLVSLVAYRNNYTSQAMGEKINQTLILPPDALSDVFGKLKF